MEQKIYLQFGVYNNSILFLALEGNFASKAWTVSDAMYHDTLGTKFQAMTADDGNVYDIGRKNIRRLKDDEEYEKLLKEAHPAFRICLAIEEWLKTNSTVPRYMEWCDMQRTLGLTVDIFMKKHPECDEAKVTELFIAFLNQY